MLSLLLENWQHHCNINKTNNKCKAWNCHFDVGTCGIGMLKNIESQGSMEHETTTVRTQIAAGKEDMNSQIASIKYGVLRYQNGL